MQRTRWHPSPAAPTLHPSPMTTTCPPDPPEFPEQYAPAVGLRLSPFCMFLIATIFSSRQQNCHHPRPAGRRSNPPTHASHGRLRHRLDHRRRLQHRGRRLPPPSDMPTSSTAALTHHRQCSTSTTRADNGCRPSHRPTWPLGPDPNTPSLGKPHARFSSAVEERLGLVRNG